jgi:hypothetical protein
MNKVISFLSQYSPVIRCHLFHVISLPFIANETMEIYHK